VVKIDQSSAVYPRMRSGILLEAGHSASMLENHELVVAPLFILMFVWSRRHQSNSM